MAAPRSRSFLHRALQSLPLGASLRRLQRYLGCYDADDFRADLGGNLCRVITTEKFINRLLDIELPPAVATPLPAHCVAHVSSRLTDIATLIARMEITATDEFWDIGSGMGGVSLLVAWPTAARTRGVEFHEEYCIRATAAARGFSIPNVTFIHADARDVPYASGNKFYMFMPFTGTVRDIVLDHLHRVAEHHPITLGWQGPREHLSDHAWLEESAASARETHTFSLKIYHSR